nr:transposase, MuDR, MULE transposase domain protein [Tanacetum cinerariifolium]
VFLPLSTETALDFFGLRHAFRFYHGVGISNSLSESDKHTSLSEQVYSLKHEFTLNHEWEEGLDIDDFDLLLTLIILPTNNTHIVPEITTTQTLVSSKNNQVDNYVEGGEESVMSTQEYIRKVIEDVGEDDDFTRVSLLSVIDYVSVDGGIVTGCFGDVKKFLKNVKLEQIVAVIKSCTPNALGDLTVTLKDFSGTISGTIHYKVLTEERFTKTFTV